MFASRKKAFKVLVLFGQCNEEGARDYAYGHYKGDQKYMKRTLGKCILGRQNRRWKERNYKLVKNAV
jgi:hypothetical protein